MNRRGFLGFLAALPLAGKLAPAVQLAKPATVIAAPLVAVAPHAYTIHRLLVDAVLRGDDGTTYSTPPCPVKASGYGCDVHWHRSL